MGGSTFDEARRDREREVPSARVEQAARDRHASPYVWSARAHLGVCCLCELSELYDWATCPYFKVSVVHTVNGS